MRTNPIIKTGETTSLLKIQCLTRHLGMEVSSKGFTLIEALIAMTVLAIGLLAIAQMQVIAIKSNAGSRDVTEATTLAEKKLEYLKILPLDDPDLVDASADNNATLTSTATVDHSDPDNPVGGVYDVVWNIADGEDTKAIAVIVSWASGPQRISKQVVMPMIIAD